MIVKNNAKRAYFYEGEAILPGTNNVAKAIDQNNPVIKALLESGELEIVEDDKLDADAAIKAINNETNSRTVHRNISQICNY
jgi:hypothetical protein